MNKLGVNGNMTPFERYWSAVPTKIARKLCADIWKRKRLDDKVEIILADIENRKRLDDRWLKGFIPNPATYLRQERWEDEIVKPHKPAAVTPMAHKPASMFEFSYDAGQSGYAAFKAQRR